MMLSDGLIGALIGGGATLLVSAMTQFIVVRNLNKQHAHDSKQKAEDRKAAMRRDVYLQFVEDVLAVHEFLGDLQNKTSADTDMSVYQRFLKSSGKVWLIADKENALLSREFTNSLSVATFTLIAGSIDVRNAVYVAGVESASLTVGIEKLAALGNAKEEGLNRPSSPVTEQLQQAAAQRFREQHGVVTLQSAASEAAADAANKQRVKYSASVSFALKPVNVLFVRLVTALRGEIGLVGDESAFLSALYEQEAMSDAAMKNVYEVLNERRKAAAAGML